MSVSGYFLRYFDRLVQRGCRVSARDQPYSACPDIRATGQVVSVTTLCPADRRGSGRRTPGRTSPCRTLTGTPTSRIVPEVKKLVSSWPQSTTSVNSGRTSTAAGCCVRCASRTYSWHWNCSTMSYNDYFNREVLSVSTLSDWLHCVLVSHWLIRMSDSSFAYYVTLWLDLYLDLVPAATLGGGRGEWVVSHPNKPMRNRRNGINHCPLLYNYQKERKSVQ